MLGRSDVKERRCCYLPTGASLHAYLPQHSIHYNGHLSFSHGGMATATNLPLYLPMMVLWQGAARDECQGGWRERNERIHYVYQRGGT